MGLGDEDTRFPSGSCAFLDLLAFLSFCPTRLKSLKASHLSFLMKTDPPANCPDVFVVAEGFAASGPVVVVDAQLTTGTQNSLYDEWHDDRNPTRRKAPGTRCEPRGTAAQGGRFCCCWSRRVSWVEQGPGSRGTRNLVPVLPSRALEQSTSVP